MAPGGGEVTDPDQRPRCKCGHDRTHYMVTPDGKYSGMGWFWVLFGVTTRPVRIEYRCRRCGEVFDETTDPQELADHI